MQIERIAVGELASNCYIVTSENGEDAVIIDPGDEGDRLIELTQKKGCRVKYIIATHGHIDHIGAISQLVKELSPRPELCVHSSDAAMLKDSEKNLAGFAGMAFSPVEADIFLRDKSVIRAGDIQMEVLHTPGHTPGGICLFINNILFTGDTLFAGGIGRTDLPGGSSDELIKSIRDRILSLDGNTKIYPGHGPESTVGSEKQSFHEWT